MVMGQNQAAAQLYDVVAATEALKDSQSGLEQTVQKLAGSRALLALSRITSGILPGFWSAQNKIRAVFDLAKIYYDSANKETEELIKNLEAIQKLGGQANLVMGLKIFDDKTMDMFSKLTDNTPTNITSGMYKKIGGEIKGFDAIEESILGREAKNQEERKEVLNTLKTLISPQRDRILERRKEIQRRREFARELKKEYEYFDVKDEQIFRKFLIRKKKQISDTLKKLPDTLKALFKMAWAFVKGFTLFVVLATLVGAVIRNAWPALKMWAAKVLEGLGLIWEAFKFAMEGLWMIVAGIFEGDLLKVAIGLGQFFVGLLLAGLGLLVSPFVGAITLIWALLGGPIYDFMKSITDSSQSLNQKVGKFLIMMGQILLVLGLIGAVVGYILTGAWVLAIGVAVVGAIVSTIGRWLGKKSIGGPASGMTLVGEQGPELVRLPTGSRVYSNAQTRTMGGNTIHVHVNGRVGASDAEIRDIADKVARHINLRMNRTGTTGTGF